MLHCETIGPGVAKIVFPDIWSAVQSQIEGVFRIFYEEPTPTAFYPHFNEVALRRTLLGQVPALAELGQELKNMLDGGTSGLIIDDMHLMTYSPLERNRFLYSLCLTFGYPTPSSQTRGSLLWNVKTKEPIVGRPATFSEHAAEAAFHTDSQIYPDPEPYFALFVEQPAQCGGGVSILFDSHALKQDILSMDGGAEALQTLSTVELPFLIQSAGAVGKKNTAITMAKVFSEKPAVRYRADVIAAGLAEKPELATETVRSALELMDRVLVSGAGRVEYRMGLGSLMLCNNHAMLHGRTEFSDHQRHLVRVRMSPIPVTVSVASLLSRQQALSAALIG